MGEWIKGREEETFGISVITVAELLHGVHRADSEKRRLTRSAFVEKVIEVFPIYFLDVPVVRIYAAVWADLSRKGTHIGGHDLMIGATALSLGFSVASFNVRHLVSTAITLLPLVAHPAAKYCPDPIAR
jgi:predicted nucleic acid-binding protein